MTEDSIPEPFGATGDKITAQAFLDSPGVADWRLIVGGGWASAHFPTASYSAGVALVTAIGELAVAADHYPDVDLRPEGVTVRLFSGEHLGLGAADVELARQITAAAGGLGLTSDPTRVQHVQVALDAMVIPAVQSFWRAVLGYEVVGAEDVLDPLRRGPSFWFQQMDKPRTERGRFHIDVYVPLDQAEARVAAGLAAGGRMVRDRGPQYWTLADPEGNEVDIAPWI